MYLLRYCCEGCDNYWYEATNMEYDKAIEYFKKRKYTSRVCPNCEVDDLYLDGVVSAIIKEEMS